MTLNCLDDKTLNKQNAIKIQQIGWKQGSLFDPKSIIDIPVLFDPENEILVIITHSCSVVSLDFKRDPLIEVLVAKKLSKFSARSLEATGKNQRRLQMEIISGKVDFKAIECDLNRRFWIERILLLNLQPLNVLVPGKEKDLSKWIARSYTRTTLPDELVHRMKKGLLDLIEKTLKGEVAGSLFYIETHEIYISYKKLDDSEGFLLHLIFVCSNQNSADKLGEELSTKLDPFIDVTGRDGLRIDLFDVRAKNQFLATDFDGYERFSEWDYFTTLGEIDSGKNFAL